MEGYKDKHIAIKRGNGEKGVDKHIPTKEMVG